jgi:hypothetical protein
VATASVVATVSVATTVSAAVLASFVVAGVLSHPAAKDPTAQQRIAA